MSIAWQQDESLPLVPRWCAIVLGDRTRKIPRQGYLVFISFDGADHLEDGVSESRHAVPRVRGIIMGTDTLCELAQEPMAGLSMEDAGLLQVEVGAVKGDRVVNHHELLGWGCVTGVGR